MISKGNVFYPKQWWGVDLCLKESLNVGSVFLVNLNFFKSILKDLSYDNRNLRQNRLRKRYCR
jgi:hypothetical protein